jgi:hypothetical protein
MGAGIERREMRKGRSEREKHRREESHERNWGR